MQVDANSKGHLILLMAPSGSGKTILLKHLKSVLPELHYAVSYTTRAKRPGEEEGKTYFFVSHAQFDKLMADGKLLEVANYGGNRYATAKSEILEPMSKGEVVVREVELQGVRSILGILPREQVTVVYIDGGDWTALKKRIISRAHIDSEELALRHQRYIAETAAKTLADKVIKNEEGKLEESKEKLVAIIKNIVNNTKDA